MERDIYNENLTALCSYHPLLYNRVLNYKNNLSRINVLTTKVAAKTFQLTVRENEGCKTLLLHSRYDPVREGLHFAQEKMQQQKKINLLYGFGMGYHVQAMANLLLEGNQLFVFEINFDVFVETLKCRDLTGIFQDTRIHLYISAERNDILGELIGLLKEKKDVNYSTHLPSINAIDQENEDLRMILLELNIRKSINENFLSKMAENFCRNNEIIKHNIGIFFNKCANKPLIIVCAGPSLDKNKHLLKGLQDKAILICVGEALKPLLQIGVTPHFIITIDPDEITYKQIEGLEHLTIPFILLATAARINAERYQGPKFIACQEEKYLKQEEKYYLIQTGGSVSTTALDIAIRMGADPIIFVGQDLAYTNNQHHCLGSTHEEVSIKKLGNMRTVKSWQGTEVPTTLGMLSFNRWIQNRVNQEPQLTFINATEGGAYINGLKHMKLQEVIEQYLQKKFEISVIIEEVIAKIML